MVWFQCEACGENLKKPKLPNHFRMCSSYKLSCIDCGEMFDKQTVLSHTQCITEAEKYGPKGQGKVANGTPAKTNKDKQRPDVDINVGLSERPPWFCSLCNTNATSKQALLLHADGKKHRAKARAYAAKQEPPAEAAQVNKDSTENNVNNEVFNDKSNVDKKENVPSSGASAHDTSLAENGNVSARKRKLDAATDCGSTENEKSLNGLGKENATQEIQEKPQKVKKTKHEPVIEGVDNKIKKCEAEKVDEGAGARESKESSKKKIKWKKLITSVLKSSPGGVLKMKKLQKVVFKGLRESGIAVDDTEFSTIVEHKVNSSSKFTVDGKNVKLAA